MSGRVEPVPWGCVGRKKHGFQGFKSSRFYLSGTSLQILNEKTTVRKCKRYASVYLSLTFITTSLLRVPDCWIHPWKIVCIFSGVLNWIEPAVNFWKDRFDHKYHIPDPTQPITKLMKLSSKHCEEPARCDASVRGNFALFLSRVWNWVYQCFVGLSAVGFLPVGLMWIDAVVFAVITQKCRTICSLAVRWQQTRAMFALGMCSSRIKSQIRSRSGLIYELHNNKYIKDVEKIRKRSKFIFSI